ncbi:MAG: PEGA domain-containing protein [Deltaproteobacteria bacterium]|nr:PEGA domain-containing protein [Deltaproteobacteria bacterium]
MSSVTPREGFRWKEGYVVGLKARIVVAVGLLWALVLVGCGTVFQGVKQGVVVNSEPSGARVFVDGNEVGRTPAVVFLRRKTDHRVDLRLDGYRDHAFTFRSAPTTWVMVANVIAFATIFPFVVDGLNGAWNSFDEEVVKVTLDPLQKR